MNHSPGFLKLVKEAQPLVAEITVAQARERLQQNPAAILIDVREDSEWNVGHAAEARHLGRGILERDLENLVRNAKNAVIGLMHGMKLDAAQHGILVNCIAPFALTRLSHGIFPKEIEAYIQPEQVAAAVAYLCSDQCTLNAEVVIAGGGHFARAVTMESQGIDIDNPADVSAEAIKRNWKKIANMKKPIVYDDALQAVGVTFEAVKRRAGLA